MKLLYNPTRLTCQIIIPDLPACEGIQKFVGFSRGWHHWNSIRLGANRSENTDFVRLFLYTYIKGKRNEQLICTAKVGMTVDVELTFKHHVFAAIIRGEFGQYSKVEYAPIYFPIGYQLYPYREQDITGVRLPFEVQISNLCIK